MNENIKELLKKLDMFSTLEDDKLRALSNISSLHTYTKNETIFTQGEISKYIMILLDGIVSVFKHSDDGNEIVIAYFTKYSLIAEAPTLRKSPLPSSGRFKTNGQLLKIKIDEFENLFMLYPEISKALIQSLLQKVDLLQKNIHFNIATNSKDKIINFYKDKSSLSLDLKQYEIASILNITAETLSRNIKKLVKEDVLYKYLDTYRVR